MGIIGPKDEKMINDRAFTYLNRLKNHTNPGIKHKITKACKKGEISNKMSEGERAIFNKIKTAINHYVEGDNRLLTDPQQGSLFGHLNGIDFTMPVQVISIDPKASLSQMQASGKGMGETRKGNYYSFYHPPEPSTEVETEARARGISPITVSKGPELGSTGEKFYASEKQLTLFYTTKEIKALQTTSETISDDWSVTAQEGNRTERVGITAQGGGNQLHINSEENDTIVPALKLKWENIIKDICNENPDNPIDAKEAKDIINTYAMVLYNRAEFNPKYIDNAIDAYVFLKNAQKSLEGSKPNPLLTEAFLITRNAILQAFEKHNIKGADVELKTRVEQRTNQEAEEPISKKSKKLKK